MQVGFGDAGSEPVTRHASRLLDYHHPHLLVDRPWRTNVAPVGHLQGAICPAIIWGDANKAGRRNQHFLSAGSIQRHSLGLAWELPLEGLMLVLQLHNCAQSEVRPV